MAATETKPSRSTKKTNPAAPAEFVCPECGKSFSRAQALGAHRSQTHGVAGTSKNARAKRTTKTPTPAASPTTARPASTRTASTRRTAVASNPTKLDRDALLQTLFPTGIPPRADVITAANDWLAEAERLARLR
jgi:hypothetical protein